MTQYTKGPWIVTARASDVGTRRNNIIAEDDSANGNFRICLTDGPDKEGNARLIAAAPELLEALQRILFEDSDKNERDRLNDRLLARAAIAKATS